MDQDPGLLDLPVPAGEGLYRRLKQSLFLDDPDMRRNPIFQVRRLVYGPAWLETAFRAAAPARDGVDLGCGSGWVALELARRHPGLRLRAVDRDAGLVEWARDYYEGRRETLGKVTWEAADLETLELPPESLDLAMALFTLGCLADPMDLLDRVIRALRPGGLLVYMDGTEPPPVNVERLAWLAGLGRPGDPWSRRRRVENAYWKDGVRRHRPEGAPPEEEVFAALERRLEVIHHGRNRAFLDFFTGRYRVREALWRLPLLKVADEAAMAAGLLRGAVRFALARRG